MMDTRLMIVMGERNWTLAALHLACAMSRREQADVLLLNMVPVRHPLLLGTEAGSLSFTAEDEAALNDMAATAEDYGVPLEVKNCQYANYWNAVADAAAQLGATAVLVNIPSSRIPYRQELRRWLLRRQLARQNQLLIALDNLSPSLTWTPSITLQDDMAAMLDRHQIQHP